MSTLEKDEIQHIIKLLMSVLESQWVAISDNEIVTTGSYSQVKLAYENMKGKKMLAIKSSPKEFQHMESKGATIDFINTIEGTNEISFN